MKRQIGVSTPCGSGSMSSGVAFAQSHRLPPCRNNAQVEQQSDIDHRQGMYEKGHRRGWYRKGGRLPSAYRGRRYVVRNWRADSLRQPPPGYNWVRSDNGDFLLVALNTGIIAGIVANAVSH